MCNLSLNTKEVWGFIIVFLYFLSEQDGAASLNAVEPRCKSAQIFILKNLELYFSSSVAASCVFYPVRLKLNEYIFKCDDVAAAWLFYSNDKWAPFMHMH